MSCFVNHRIVRWLSIAVLVVMMDQREALAQKMYWTDWDLGIIRRADLDGRNSEGLVPELHFPAIIALDVVSGKMYWDKGSSIQRANLDGSGIETLVSGRVDPEGIALDVGTGKMYWTNRFSETIQRANLDGSNEEIVLTGLGSTRGIALDVGAGKMYWAAYGSETIRRANLDGSQVETLVAGVPFPQYIALDVGAGKMYWTDSDGHRIQRANLDGTGVETLVMDLVTPIGIALDVRAGKMYWTDPGANTIQRANLDGSDVETLIAGLPHPRGIALDLSCTLDFDANYATGTLNLDFELGNTIPVFFSTGIWFQNHVVPYWSILLRPIDPPVSFSVPIEDFPQVGEIVVWTTLHSRGVRRCDDVVTVDTGTPEVMPSAEELQELLRRQVP